MNYSSESCDMASLLKNESQSKYKKEKYNITKVVIIVEDETNENELKFCLALHAQTLIRDHFNQIAKHVIEK